MSNKAKDGKEPQKPEAAPAPVCQGRQREQAQEDWRWGVCTKDEEVWVVWFQEEQRGGTRAGQSLLEPMTKNSLLAQGCWKAKAQILSKVNCLSLLLERGQEKIRSYEKSKQENELFIRRQAFPITLSTFLKLLTLKLPVQKVLAFSGWFPPPSSSSLPEYFQRPHALLLEVPSICRLQEGRGLDREELKLLRLHSPNNFTHTAISWVKARAHKDRPQLSKTSQWQRHQGHIPWSWMVFQVRQPTTGLKRQKDTWEKKIP